MWVNKSDRLPDKTRRYPVIIECNGLIKDGYCEYSVKKKKFHFDMHSINWSVVAWFDLPEYNFKN